MKHIHNWNIYFFSFTKQFFTPLLSTSQRHWLDLLLDVTFASEITDGLKPVAKFLQQLNGRPEIWFWTFIISSLNFSSGKVIPKYEFLFKSGWHPPTPAATHIWCSNIPTIWNPTINNYQGTGRVFDKATLLKCIIDLDFYNPLKRVLELQKRAITNTYIF